MTQDKSAKPGLDDQRQSALSRWDSDGGAGVQGPQEDLVPADALPPVPDLANSELVQMRIRLIGLENLVIALLAGASEQQLELAREVSAYIAPRPGVTPHPLTLRAARQIDHLIKRAGHFGAITQA